MLDSGYRVPGGYTGRVPMGLGLGPNSVTHWKPVPTSTHDPHIHGGSIASGKDYIVTANISYILSYRITFMIFKVYFVLSIGKAT